MEIPDSVDLSVFFAILNRHLVERFRRFFAPCNRSPFSVLCGLTKNAGLRLHIEIVVQAADLVNSMLVTDPNVSVDAAISTDCNIQVITDDMPHAPGSAPPQGPG